MRSFSRLLPVALLLFASPAPAPGQTGNPPLALTHATVVDVRGGTLREDQTILIEGSRIAGVGPDGSVTIPAGAWVVDAGGRYVIPGLWDMHVHSAANPAWHFPLFVAHGVTGVRNLHSTVDTALDLTNSIKRRLADGELLGPRFVANGPIFDGSESAYPGVLVVRNGVEARAAVDSMAANDRPQPADRPRRRPPPGTSHDAAVAACGVRPRTRISA